MSIIRYAVEVETGTTFSNPNYGITGGYFRFVTDRPTYNGSTTIPVGDNSDIKLAITGATLIGTSFQTGELYAASNGDFKTANSVPKRGMIFTNTGTGDFFGAVLADSKGSSLVANDMFRVLNADSGSESVEYIGNNRWYNGFLSKDGLGSCSRSVNIDTVGTYGTISGFNFSINNFNSVAAWIEDNNIYITGRRVRFFCIIDDVFYQVWNGIVKNNYRDDVEYRFQCIDNFRQIHDKNKIPPQQITKTNFPDVGDDVDGEVIPVCIGDVPYAKLMNINAETEVVWSGFAVKQYEANMTGNSYIVIYNGPSGATLTTYDTGIPEDAKTVDDLYLQAINGGTTELIKITKWDALFLESRWWPMYRLDKPLGVSPTDFNTENNTEDGTVNTDTWWFRVIKISFKGVVSTKEISAYIDDLNTSKTFLKQYDTEQNTYVNINRLLLDKKTDDSDSEIKYPHIKYVAKSISDSFDVGYYTYITGDYKYLNAGNGVVYSGTVDDLKDYDRSTAVRVVRGASKDNFAEIRMFCSIPDEFKTLDYEKIYFLVDNTDNSEYRSGYKKQLDITLSFATENNYTGFVPYTIAFPTGTDETLSEPIFNTLPDEYYTSQGTGNYDLNSETSRFSSYFTGDAEDAEVRTYFEINNDILSRIKDGVYKYINISIKIKDNNAIVTGSEFDAAIKLPDSPTQTIAYAFNNPNGYIYQLGEEYGKPNNAPPPVGWRWVMMDDTDFTDGEIASAAVLPVGVGLILEVTNNGAGTEAIFNNQSDSAVYYIDVLFKQVGFAALSNANLQNNDMYARVNGEEFASGVETNNVYNAYRHILENYDGLHSDFIDYGNLATERISWNCGKQLLKRGSSFDELKNLCSQSMVCIVPTRKGNRKLNAFIDDDTTIYTHDESIIVRDSIKSYKTTPVLDLYNNFEIKYNWDNGREKFTKSFIVSNVGEDNFPTSTATDSSGNLLWPQYVSGLNDTSYSSAKIMWETCHDAFLRSNTSYSPPENVQQLDWFIDKSIFDDSGSYIGVDSSAWKFLEQIAGWTSRPKADIEYELPITTDTVIYELLDNTLFSDILITDGDNVHAKITGIKVDPKKDSLIISAKMAPIDFYETGLIIERGNVGDDTITELGNTGLDTITETGV